MSFQVQPAPRMRKAPTKNSARCDQARRTLAGGDGGKRRRPPARQQQQARRRSGGRTAPAADRDATRPVREYRPNCRSRRRPNRSPGSFCQRVTAQRVEGASARFGIRSPMSTEGVPMASLSDGALRLGCGSFAAGHGAKLQRPFVTGFGRLDRLVGNAAPGLVGFEEFHHGRLGCRETRSPTRKPPCVRPCARSRRARPPPFFERRLSAA